MRPPPRPNGATARRELISVVGAVMRFIAGPRVRLEGGAGARRRFDRGCHRWNRNPRPQPQKFSKLTFLTYFRYPCMFLNWSSGALVGVGGSDFIGQVAGDEPRVWREDVRKSSRLFVPRRRSLPCRSGAPNRRPGERKGGTVAKGCLRMFERVGVVRA